MKNNVFTKSEGFKSEYSCAVIRVGELEPIEGSDFLAKTLVQGTQIVVRKDQVHTGDVMFYAANETQLSDEFLSVNNQYEIGCREKNANADEVNAILKPYTDTKPKIEELRNEAKGVKSSIEQIKKNSAKLEKDIKKKTIQLEAMSNTATVEYGLLKAEIDDKRKMLKTYADKLIGRKATYDGLKSRIEEMVKVGEPYVAEAKKKVGFFGKYGRVRCLTLRGEASFGYLFGINEMVKYDGSVTEEDVMSCIDQEFDTVNGKLFCKAYVPPVKEVTPRGEKGVKAKKKLSKFDRLDDNSFEFHYDTEQLQKNIRFIAPDDIVTISLKIHGTSQISSKLHVRYPDKIALWKRAINGLCKTLGSKKPFIDYHVDWGPVYSSRTVIKNRYINKEVNSGYYNVDIWSEWGDAVYKYLDEGMEIYGEIFGRLENGTWIQKLYDYGCDNLRPNFLMVYRITTPLDNGEKYEWNVTEVREWTERLAERMRTDGSKYAERIHPIDILYHGTLRDLYPELDVNNHWHENVLARLKTDTEHFGMERNEPLCKNAVPREGLVLRIDDSTAKAMKLKCQAFLQKEATLYDSADYQDIEVTQGDYNTEETVQ